MSERTYAVVEQDGKRYVFERDEYYAPEHSGDPEYGDADLKQEQDKLDSGEWVALTVDIFRPCDNGTHCHGCKGWVPDPDDPNLGGIVVPWDEDLAAFVRQQL